MLKNKINNNLEKIIISLFQIGRHLTQDINVSYKSIGLNDSSYLLKKIGKNIDEYSTFKENELMIK